MTGSEPHNADDLALYYHEYCPFCIKVLRVVERLGVDIELRNILAEPSCRRELIAGGGRSMVPCLRITGDDGRHTWMYESTDIADYLIHRFGQRAASG